MAFFRRITNLLRRPWLDREISEELQAHIDLATEDNVRQGLPRAAARREALLRFGNPASTRERVTAADTTLSLEALWRDLRYALRQLRRSPGFACTAVCTLALGIGANVVVFGVLNAMLLHPLDLPVSNRLFEIAQRGQGNLSHSYPDFVDLRGRNTAFDDLATYRINEAGLSSPMVPMDGSSSVGWSGSAQRSWIYEASSSYFDMLGVQPALGRFFHSSDEHGPNSMPYIVLSDAFWHTRFNADPHIIGTTVDLNKHPFTVIGVAPGTFNGTELFFWPDFWMPLVNEEQIEGYSILSKRSMHGLYVLGVLKPGVSKEQATTNLNAVAAQLARQYPQTDDGMALRLVQPGLMGDMLGGPARAFLFALMALSLLVLAAACVNLASIFAARSADRTRELAIRLSIGSTHGRLLRQVLTEAVLVSLAGGLAGTAFAVALLGALTRWRPVSEVPIHVAFAPDARTYAIALLFSIFSGLLPGLLPARQIWRTSAMQAMKGSAQPSGLLRRLNLRDLLLGIQIALCALLVTAALVSLRGMERSLHAPIGFEPHGATLAMVDMGMAGYKGESALPLQRRILEEASRIPGVTAIGSIDGRPLGLGGNGTSVFRDSTTDFRPANVISFAKYFAASPGYFNAARTRMLAGRDVSWGDGPKTPQIVIVNATLAHRLFGEESPLGRHLRTFGGSRYLVVGMVEDGKYDNLPEEPTGALFFPLGQYNNTEITFVVRSQRPPAEINAALSRLISGIDSQLPVDLRTWDDGLALVLFPARIATAALGTMGLLAAMLAITGVFGMSAYTISKRLRELGIRVALGAHRVQVARTALGRPLVVLVSGSLAGLGLGILASRFLSYVVYQASSRDPFVLLGAVAAMILIGLVATWIPARRALSVNPAQLLRDE
jgi:predicted permease